VQGLGVEDEFVGLGDAWDVAVVEAEDAVVLVWARHASDESHCWAEVDVLVPWFVFERHHDWKGCESHVCG
jgi:hypothetical protein